MHPFLTPSHEKFRLTVREFATKEIKEIARKLDDTSTFSPELTRKMGQFGLFGMNLTEKYGGTNMDTLSYM
jgi:short/branched chain acyl-CoA dehydrogenase